MLSHRLATEDDLPALLRLMDMAISDLQKDFLTPDQIKASREVMGVDSQLIRDRTYFVIEEKGKIVGCGGWSFRETLFGGDHSDGRDPAKLDPDTQPARIRAMYCHPAHTRKGIGRLIMTLCETAILAHGFKTAELMATMAGVPLYCACGYHKIRDHRAATSSGTYVPLSLMRKKLDSPVH